MPESSTRVITVLMSVIAHVLDSVTELRRAVRGAEWAVHMDDLVVPWDEAEGYALPGCVTRT